jgi:hypothetical protein
MDDLVREQSNKASHPKVSHGGAHWELMVNYVILLRSLI